MYFYATLGRGVEDFRLLAFSVLLVVDVVEVKVVVVSACGVEEEEDVLSSYSSQTWRDQTWDSVDDP